MSKTNNSNSNSNSKKTVKKKRSKQIGGSDSINVLTWNICWQAMKGETTTNGTANALATTCSTSSLTNADGLNRCVKNVINLIDNLSIDYDFVALQEPEKWEIIFDNSTKLNTMGYVHHKPGSTSQLVTFYNKKKYYAQAVLADTITYNGKRGRPYHIIYFKNKITQEFYIFINLHNAHNMPKDELEKQLATNFNNFKKIKHYQQKRADNLIETSKIDWNNNYNVIVAGDFNDDGTMNYWQGFKPFKYTDISILKDLKVKCDVKPPNTCCREVISAQPDKSGDYILVNNSLTIERSNYIPNSGYLFPSSDHLPVLIQLKSTTAVSAPIQPQTIQSIQTIQPPIKPQTIQSIEPTIEPIQSIEPTIKPPETQPIEKPPEPIQSIIKPPEPPETRPTQPETRPTQPIQSQPSQPIQSQPSQPIQSQPSQPIQSQPTQPIQSQPTQPTQIEQIEKTETESSNMFSAPLLAMIVAVPIIFLLSK